MEKKKNEKRKKAKRKLALSSSDSEISQDGYSSGQSAWVESESDNDFSTPKWWPVKKEINENVIFRYDGKFYPGKIVEMSSTEAKISSMTAMGRLCQTFWYTSGSQSFQVVAQ